MEIDKIADNSSGSTYIANTNVRYGDHFQNFMKGLNSEPVSSHPVFYFSNNHNCTISINVNEKK